VSAALSGGLLAAIPREQSRRGDYPRFWAMSDALLCALATAVSLQLVHHGNVAWARLLAEFSAAPVTVALLAMWGSYRSLPANWIREYRAMLVGSALGFGVGEVLAGLAGNRGGLAMEFALAWALALLLLLQAHTVRHLLLGRTTSEEKRAVILGNPAQVRNVYSALSQAARDERSHAQRLRIAALFSDGGQEWADAKNQNVVVSETRWAKSFVECCDIEHGILAVPKECDRETEELFGKSADIFKYLLVAPQIAGAGIKVIATAQDGSPLSLLVGEDLAHRAGPLKRATDFLGALILGVLGLPFIIAVAVVIKLTSSGSVLYKQVRIGKGNRAFKALKFRTMYSNSRERLNDYLAQDPALREQWESVHKLKDDPRVTPIGRFLRRFSLDELPQLWNVLAGEMSLVGPRPIVVAEIEKYGEDYAAYERARPGLTGLWQVSGRNNTTYRERVNYDSYYVRNWSVWLDLTIIARTFRAVISGVGAY
jgi:Undecaprenyl-phosphate galactose phosphotransferase WbaP